jgi:hypothetical protein
MAMVAARDVQPVTPIDPPAVVVTTDSPFKVPGLNVMIVEESGDRSQLPEGQRDILGSQPWRQAWYGKGGEIRIIDPTDQHPNDLPKWQAGVEAVMNSGTKLPAYAISDGTKSAIGPLPLDMVAWDSLLATYGGQKP